MSEFRMIPLSKLVESEDNVRRTDRRADIEPLAEDIFAHGVLQNLSVTESENGRFAVCAGGRRHAALKLLSKQKRIPRAYLVPCMIVPAEHAAETSLSENIQRVAMNAMDEVEAFAALVESGLLPEDVARRYGATLRHVEQRLALAALSPSIRQAYRHGDINLDVAKAFCLCADHETQERVFKGLGKPINNAHVVRNALTQGRMHLSDRLARFVGVEAYQAAGGRIVTDLFAEDVAFLEDGEIIQRLAMTKADAIAEALRTDGWGWIEINLAGGQIEGCAGERLRATQRALKPAEKRRLQSIQSEIHSIDEELEGMEDDHAADALWDKRETLDGARDALIESTRAYDSALMAHAGAAIGLDRDGKAQIVRGLIRRSDLKTIEKLRKKASGEDAQDDESGAAPTTGLSKALMRDLTLARTCAIRKGVAQTPHVALALLVAVLSGQSSNCGDLVGPDINTTARDFADECELAELKAALPLPESFGDALQLDTADLLARLAVLVAETIDLTHEGAGQRDVERQSSGDAIASAIGLDMRACWAPDASFWMRTSRQFALDAVDAAKLFPETSRTSKLKALAKLKKADFAEAVAKAFEASRWLPSCLITPETPSASVASSEDQTRTATH